MAQAKCVPFDFDRLPQAQQSALTGLTGLALRGLVDSVVKRKEGLVLIKCQEWFNTFVPKPLAGTGVLDGTGIDFCCLLPPIEEHVWDTRPVKPQPVPTLDDMGTMPSRRLAYTGTF